MKVIIIGCGRVGSGLAKNLSLQGIDVAVIDNDPTAFAALGPTFKGKTFLGIGFDQKVLSEAGIDRADALAAVTASDEANLVAARMAKTFFRVPRVAARVYEPRKANIYRRLGIQTISPVTLGIDRMTAMLTYSQLKVEQIIGAGQVGMMEVEVRGNLINKTLKDFEIPGELEVSALTRNGKTFMPSNATVFQPGDLLHACFLVSAREKLSKIIGA